MQSHMNKKMSFLMTSIATMLSCTAFAAELRLDHPALGYWNFNDPKSLIFIADSGKIDWFQNNEIVRSEQYSIADASCQPSNADSMSGLGLVLSWPYLVGTNRVCLIDSNSKTIHLIHEIPMPQNAYSTMFLSEDKNFSYFIVLGRPWETLGYLKLWVVNKKSQSAEQKDFFINVPDYSGGMWRDGENLYVTLSIFDPVDPQNNIYQLDIDSLVSLLPSAGSLDFEAHFKKTTGPFPGFTFTLIGEKNWFLYFNEGYESFFLNKNSGEIIPTTIEEGCKPIGIQNKNLITLCNKQNLKNIPLAFD